MMIDAVTENVSKALAEIENRGESGFINDILDDPCASYWLKDAIRHSTRRDPCDVLSEMEILLAIAIQRAHKVGAI